MQQVISLGLQDDFIRGLTDILQEEFISRGIPLEKVAVVFGGRRPELFLKRELSRRLKGAYFPPVFFSMDDFVREVIERKRPVKTIRAMDATYRIYELAKQTHQGLLMERNSFAAFLPWAEEIHAFIEQLDLEKIDDDTLRQVQESAKIGYDALPEVNLLLEDMAALRKEFHRCLEKEGLFTRGMLYMNAAEYAEDNTFNDFEAVIFCGFFYLHKSEQDLVNKLLTGGKARLVFQGDESEWPVLRNLSGVFAKPIKTADAQPRTEPRMHFYRGFDMHSQVGILRERLKELKNPEEALILLANPDALVPLLSEISSLGVDFNVSIGYPLKRSAVFSLFQDIFAAQLSRKPEGSGLASDKPEGDGAASDGRSHSPSHKPEGSGLASYSQSHKGSAYYSRDYLKVLSHPFLKNLSSISPQVSRVTVHKVEEALNGTIKNELAGELFIRLDEISASRDMLSEAQDTLKNMETKVSLEDIAGTLKELHELAFGIWEPISNFHEFSLAARKVIMALLEKSPLEKYAPNLKVAQKILELLDELRGAAFSGEQFSPEEMFRIFNQRLEHEMVSFSGSPLKGMQILGLLETRSLTFKQVIAMDVNESILPKLRIYEPLIPRDVMVSLGIDRLETEEEIQRYQFTRLIQAAEEVHLIYREDRETVRSRFLEELIWKKEQELGDVGIVTIPQYSFNIKALPKKAMAKKNKDMIAFLKKRVFSASSVNMYLSCPLSFYFRYCLGLSEKEDLFDEPEAKDVGTFAHALLEKTYTGFLNKKPVINEKFEKLFFAEFNELFKKEFSRKMKADAFLLEHILNYRMKKFLEAEKERRDIDELLMLERKIPWKIETESGEFDFSAVVDRVDRLSSGGLLVIDYKTGSAQMPSANLGEIALSREGIKNSVKSFQLPIYIWACREYSKAQEVSAALYFLRTSELQVYLQKSTPEKKEENLTACHKALSFILDEIVNPDVDFISDEDAEHKCGYCPYVALCR
ncbi:MAG: hypothetical protein A2Y00_10450 [Omnitrophica WOR_2 bacterium GWF2_43_52]|nr:MAG: hypothetical protein A2Y00_10450 [Omnitrophica WOR_2 bacterium GWF2_43_52]HAH20176.1 hypothetical protein [Candidatus Omnitrophota bacterium]HBG63044.1 hypothetical protein [Candidatus Omnitrophota bacterium]